MSRIYLDNAFQPRRNHFGIVDAYDKIGSFTAIDKPDRERLFGWLSDEMPLVPSGFAVIDDGDVEVIVVAMVATVDINIKVGKAFFHHTHVTPKRTAFGNRAVLLGENTMVKVKLCKAAQCHYGEYKCKKQLFHAVNISKN